MITENDTKIFVVYHNGVTEFPEIYKNKNIYVPIQGGTFFGKSNLFDYSLYDNDGEDNYSYLNKFINEMTAYYWISKNYEKTYPDTKVFGLMHYSKSFKWDFDLLNRLEQSGNRFMIFSFVKTLYTIHHDFGISHMFTDKFKTNGIPPEILTFKYKTIFNDFICRFLTKNPEYAHMYFDFSLKCHESVQASMFLMDKQTFSLYCKFVQQYVETINEVLKDKSYLDFFEFLDKNGTDKYQIAHLKRIYGFFGEVMSIFFMYWATDGYKDKSIKCIASEKIMFDKLRLDVHRKNVDKTGLV